MEGDGHGDQEGRQVGVGEEFGFEVVQEVGVPEGLDDAEGRRDEEKIEEDEDRQDLFAGLDLDDGREDLVQAAFRHEVASKDDGSGR